jgi:hypothetical protein
VECYSSTLKRRATYSPSRRLLCLVLICAGWLHGTQVISPKMLPLPSLTDLVWDASRGRLFAIAGSNIVIINPDSAQVEDTFPSGDASYLALSAGGQYLYTLSYSTGIVRRYRLPDRTVDVEYRVKEYATAIAVPPGEPQSLIVATSLARLELYDNGVLRRGTLPIDVQSLYARPSDGAIFGWSEGHVYQFTVSPAGVAIARSLDLPFTFSQSLTKPTWNGNLLMDSAGNTFDLKAWKLLGRAAVGKGCAWAPDSSGASVVGIDNSDRNAPRVVRYSLDTFRPTDSASVVGLPEPSDLCRGFIRVRPWGSDGIAVSGFMGLPQQDVMLLRVSDLDPVVPAPIPLPETDASGVIHLPVRANSLAYDANRKLLWASIPGVSGQIGNTVIAIDPATGRILDSIFAGSEPGQLSLASDGGRLFALLGGVPAVATLDLNARHLAQTFNLQEEENFRPLSLAAVPGQSNVVAVARAPGNLQHSSNVAVYDNGIRRPKSVAGYLPNSGATFIGVSPSALYAGDSPNTVYGAVLDLTHGDDTSDAVRLIVDETGIALDSVLVPVPLGDTRAFGAQAGGLVYEGDELRRPNGRPRGRERPWGALFTGGGELRSPDGKTRLGTFSTQQGKIASGIPVPLSDRNQVVYVHVTYETYSVAVTLFDLTSHRPIASLSLQGSSNTTEGIVVAAVRVGGDKIAVSAYGEILLVTLASLKPWPASSRVLESAGPNLQRLNLAVNAIDSVPGTSKLILATPSAAGDLGNSIVLFDASEGRVESAVYAGSEPSLMAQVPGRRAVYVALAGERRVARIDLASMRHDLVFVADPDSRSNQYEIFDMTASASGALALSYMGGGIAIFDNGVPRPVFDPNTEGTSAYSGGGYELAFDSSGTVLYARETRWTPQALKRCAVSPEGVRWLSSVDWPVIGNQYRYAQGLLYTNFGAVIDPERSRVVGRFAVDNMWPRVAPDLPGGRVFFVSEGALRMYDLNTRALLGQMPIPAGEPLNLVRFGDDGLAFPLADTRTGHTQVYFARISAIPLLPTPVSSPQPSLPVTPGVRVVDLAAKDIAYDVSRDLIYASIPNREAALGDRIAAIDPASGNMARSWQTGINPNLLAISDDQSYLHYTVGRSPITGASSFSLQSEVLRTLDLRSGETGSAFPVRATAPDLSSLFISGIAPLPGESRSVAVVEYVNRYVDGIAYYTPDSLRIYDDGAPRPISLGAPPFSCPSLVGGASASRLYCSYKNSVSRLSVDKQGVTTLDSFNLTSGRGDMPGAVFSGGRLYTYTGLVLDPESKREIASLETQGLAAVDGSLVHWLEPSTSKNIATLRSFDIGTLQPVATRQINVTSTFVTRLISCGHGRLAFAAGNEIYIVDP